MAASPRSAVSGRHGASPSPYLRSGPPPPLLDGQSEKQLNDSNIAYLRAARSGHLDKVLESLQHGVDINYQNSNGLNALHLASKEGHNGVVVELIQQGIRVGAATKKGNTALHIASLAGKLGVVKILVEHRAKVNAQSQAGFTALYMAAQENQDKVVQYLLQNGANPSLTTEEGYTPLAVALQQKSDRAVTVLLEHGQSSRVKLPALHIAAKKDDVGAASLLLKSESGDKENASGFTPLHIASHYGNVNVAKFLIDKGATVNFKAKNSITPMHVASKWGQLNMVLLLYDRGGSVNGQTKDGLTPLHCAARSGYDRVVDNLLERGADHSAKTKSGLSALHMAAQGDHVDCARLLLHYRAQVNDVTVDLLTALHIAAHYGHKRTAKLLLDRNCDPNARALNGFTPLHIACKKNRIKVVELLLQYSAAVEHTTESGLTPLHVASFMGNMAIVLELLEARASVDKQTVRGETPLHLAARSSQTDVMRVLLRNKANVNAAAREQQTPLHVAARMGQVDNVMLLLQHGASPDALTKDGYTPLHITAKEGHEEAAMALMEQGASPNATTKRGMTPIHISAKYGKMGVARALLNRGANADAKGKNGLTPLHVAAHYNQTNVALLLLDNHASPHCTAKNGYTPLHIAAKKNQMDIATTLLEFGARPNAESKTGFTPLHLATQEGHTDMVSLLLEHSSSVNATASNGITPMHLCAQEDHTQVAEVLCKYRAVVDSKTNAGYTPLHTASHFGQLGMVRFLLEKGASVDAITRLGYTPLHQAAQQGHVLVINHLLKKGASPNAKTNTGVTPMAIARRLGYVSVDELLKSVTVESPGTEQIPMDRYRMEAPEKMEETFFSDTDEEGDEHEQYAFLASDNYVGMKDDAATPKDGFSEMLSPIGPPGASFRMSKKGRQPKAISSAYGKAAIARNESISTPSMAATSSRKRAPPGNHFSYDFYQGSSSQGAVNGDDEASESTLPIYSTSMPRLKSSGLRRGDRERRSEGQLRSHRSRGSPYDGGRTSPSHGRGYSEQTPRSDSFDESRRPRLRPATGSLKDTLSSSSSVERPAHGGSLRSPPRHRDDELSTHPRDRQRPRSAGSSTKKQDDRHLALLTGKQDGRHPVSPRSPTNKTPLSHYGVTDHRHDAFAERERKRERMPDTGLSGAQGGDDEKFAMANMQKSRDRRGDRHRGSVNSSAADFYQVSDMAGLQYASVEHVADEKKWPEEEGSSMSRSPRDAPGLELQPKREEVTSRSREPKGHGHNSKRPRRRRGGRRKGSGSSGSGSSGTGSSGGSQDGVNTIGADKRNSPKRESTKDETHSPRSIPRSENHSPKNIPRRETQSPTSTPRSETHSPRSGQKYRKVPSERGGAAERGRGRGKKTRSTQERSVEEVKAQPREYMESKEDWVVEQRASRSGSSSSSTSASIERGATRRLPQYSVTIGEGRVASSAEVENVSLSSRDTGSSDATVKGVETDDVMMTGTERDDVIMEPNENNNVTMEDAVNVEVPVKGVERADAPMMYDVRHSDTLAEDTAERHGNAKRPVPGPRHRPSKKSRGSESRFSAADDEMQSDDRLMPEEEGAELGGVFIPPKGGHPNMYDVYREPKDEMVIEPVKAATAATGVTHYENGTEEINGDDTRDAPMPGTIELKPTQEQPDEANIGETFIVTASGRALAPATLGGGPVLGKDGKPVTLGSTDPSTGDQYVVSPDGTILTTNHEPVMHAGKIVRLEPSGDKVVLGPSGQLALDADRKPLVAPAGSELVRTGKDGKATRSGDTKPVLDSDGKMLILKTDKMLVVGPNRRAVGEGVEGTGRPVLVEQGSVLITPGMENYVVYLNGRPVLNNRSEPVCVPFGSTLSYADRDGTIKKRDGSVARDPGARPITVADPHGAYVVVTPNGDLILDSHGRPVRAPLDSELIQPTPEGYVMTSAGKRAVGSEGKAFSMPAGQKNALAVVDQGRVVIGPDLKPLSVLPGSFLSRPLPDGTVRKEDRSLVVNKDGEPVRVNPDAKGYLLLPDNHTLAVFDGEYVRPSSGSVLIVPGKDGKLKWTDGKKVVGSDGKSIKVDGTASNPGAKTTGKDPVIIELGNRLMRDSRGRAVKAPVGSSIVFADANGEIILPGKGTKSTPTKSPYSTIPDEHKLLVLPARNQVVIGADSEPVCGTDGKPVIVPVGSKLAVPGQMDYILGPDAKPVSDVSGQPIGVNPGCTVVAVQMDWCAYLPDGSKVTGLDGKPMKMSPGYNMAIGPDNKPVCDKLGKPLPIPPQSFVVTPRLYYILTSDGQPVVDEGGRGLTVDRKTIMLPRGKDGRAYLVSGEMVTDSVGRHVPVPTGKELLVAAGSGAPLLNGRGQPIFVPAGSTFAEPSKLFYIVDPARRVVENESGTPVYVTAGSRLYPGDPSDSYVTLPVDGDKLLSQRDNLPLKVPRGMLAAVAADGHPVTYETGEEVFVPVGSVIVPPGRDFVVDVDSNAVTDAVNGIAVHAEPGATLVEAGRTGEVLLPDGQKVLDEGGRPVKVTPCSLVLVDRAMKLVNDGSGRPHTVPRGSAVAPVEREFVMGPDGKPVAGDNGESLRVMPGTTVVPVDSEGRTPDGTAQDNQVAMIPGSTILIGPDGQPIEGPDGKAVCVPEGSKVSPPTKEPKVGTLTRKKSSTAKERPAIIEEIALVERANTVESSISPMTNGTITPPSLALSPPPIPSSLPPGSLPWTLFSTRGPSKDINTVEESYSGPTFGADFNPDNVIVDKSPIFTGFLVSYMVDARGGAMRGCRHAGVRMIIPPGKAASPIRVTCRMHKKEKIAHSPPLKTGEALAARIVELGPMGTRFLGPVVIEIPHFAAVSGRKEREVTVMRSEDGKIWKEHTVQPTDQLVYDTIGDSFDDVEPLDELEKKGIVRIVTTEFPRYFALVSRPKMNSGLIGPSGGILSSTVVPQVQAVFPKGALKKEIRLGIQAEAISPETIVKMFGNRSAVSAVVTVEPRRRKFHKSITMTIPLPRAATQGMINQYGPGSRNLRLLQSISDEYSPTKWEDITDSDSSSFSFVDDCISFTTTLSAKYWLVDLQTPTAGSMANGSPPDRPRDITTMAGALYRQAASVPFKSRFVVFARRREPQEASLRVFCMTDDKIDKTLEMQENFVEIARSRDIEVEDNRPLYVEMAGNLVPITKSGDRQVHMNFHAFRENRLPLTVKVRDESAEAAGRIAFMRNPKVAKGDPSQSPLCNLHLRLADAPQQPDPVSMATGSGGQQISEFEERYRHYRDLGIVARENVYSADLKLSKVAAEVGEDWRLLAHELGVSNQDVDSLEKEEGDGVYKAEAVLQLWVKAAGPAASGNRLSTALHSMKNKRAAHSAVSNVKLVTDKAEEEEARKRLGLSSSQESQEESSDMMTSQVTESSTSTAHDVPEQSISRDIAENQEAPPESPVNQMSDDQDSEAEDLLRYNGAAEDEDELVILPLLDDRRGVRNAPPSQEEQEMMSEAKVAALVELLHGLDRFCPTPELPDSDVPEEDPVCEAPVSTFESAPPASHDDLRDSDTEPRDRLSSAGSGKVKEEESSPLVGGGKEGAEDNQISQIDFEINRETAVGAQSPPGSELGTAEERTLSAAADSKDIEEAPEGPVIEYQELTETSYEGSRVTTKAAYFPEYLPQSSANQGSAAVQRRHGDELLSDSEDEVPEYQTYISSDDEPLPSQPLHTIEELPTSLPLAPGDHRRHEAIDITVATGLDILSRSGIGDQDDVGSDSMRASLPATYERSQSDLDLSGGASRVSPTIDPRHRHHSSPDCAMPVTPTSDTKLTEERPSCESNTYSDQRQTWYKEVTDEQVTRQETSNVDRDNEQGGEAENEHDVDYPHSSHTASSPAAERLADHSVPGDVPEAEAGLVRRPSDVPPPEPNTEWDTLDATLNSSSSALSTDEKNVEVQLQSIADMDPPSGTSLQSAAEIDLEAEVESSSERDGDTAVSSAFNFDTNSDANIQVSADADGDADAESSVCSEDPSVRSSYDNISTEMACYDNSNVGEMAGYQDDGMIVYGDIEEMEEIDDDEESPYSIYQDRQLSAVEELSESSSNERLFDQRQLQRVSSLDNILQELAKSSRIVAGTATGDGIPSNLSEEQPFQQFENKDESNEYVQEKPTSAQRSIDVRDGDTAPGMSSPPDDDYDLSSVDSFATVVRHDEEGEELPAETEDRLAEISSLTSSFQSDHHQISQTPPPCFVMERPPRVNRSDSMPSPILLRRSMRFPTDPDSVSTTSSLLEFETLECDMVSTGSQRSSLTDEVLRPSSLPPDIEFKLTGEPPRLSSLPCIESEEPSNDVQRSTRSSAVGVETVESGEPREYEEPTDEIIEEAQKIIRNMEDQTKVMEEEEKQFRAKSEGEDTTPVADDGPVPVVPLPSNKGVVTESIEKSSTDDKPTAVRNIPYSDRTLSEDSHSMIESIGEDALKQAIQEASKNVENFGEGGEGDQTIFDTSEQLYQNRATMTGTDTLDRVTDKNDVELLHERESELHENSCSTPAATTELGQGNGSDVASNSSYDDITELLPRKSHSLSRSKDSIEEDNVSGLMTRSSDSIEEDGSSDDEDCADSITAHPAYQQMTESVDSIEEDYPIMERSSDSIECGPEEMAASVDSIVSSQAMVHSTDSMDHSEQPSTGLEQSCDSLDQVIPTVHTASEALMNLSHRSGDSTANTNEADDLSIGHCTPSKVKEDQRYSRDENSGSMDSLDNEPSASSSLQTIVAAGDFHPKVADTVSHSDSFSSSASVSHAPSRSDTSPTGIGREFSRTGVTPPPLAQFSHDPYESDYQYMPRRKVFTMADVEAEREAKRKARVGSTDSLASSVGGGSPPPPTAGQEETTKAGVGETAAAAASCDSAPPSSSASLVLGEGEAEPGFGCTRVTLKKTLTRRTPLFDPAKQPDSGIMNRAETSALCEIIEEGDSPPPDIRETIDALTKVFNEYDHS